MPKNRSKILAIDPGTRHMGVAFLDSDLLIYAGVKVIKNRKSPHEILWTGRKIVLRLINDFKPHILVVEKTFFFNNRNASLLNVLVDEIRAIGRRKGIKVASFAPSTMKKIICGNGHASKKEVARVVVAKYPELKVFLTQDRAWKEEFHQNMFDAIGLGMMITKYTDYGKAKNFD
ncbi:MAG: crossover junction endodeoxyribonuclease RuvC [Thermodesulfobacteriota bacterium]|nr:MAG: crossover junction endodeoxyribonuclease RuvC [Thermodesulfobacteriota bacterium]